jgi:hypothetical protein
MWSQNGQVNFIRLSDPLIAFGRIAFENNQLGITLYLDCRREK